MYERKSDDMNVREKLGGWKRGTIQKSELEELFAIHSDAELYRLISTAEDERLLAPIKSSTTNGNHAYPIYLKYRITIKADRDADSMISLLNPKLIENGYLRSKPELYQKYKAPIDKLSRYLFLRHPVVSVAKKERSYEIFGDEKQLDDRTFINLLSRCGLDADSLGYYETPEFCFNDYIPTRKPELTLLICENKDIWFNIRRRMYENQACSILDARIDGVVYGCGNRISEVGALSGYTRFLGAERVRYLYWGDIDCAGFDIYASLIRHNPGLDIMLFWSAYEIMLELANGRALPDSTDNRDHTSDYPALLEACPDKVKAQLCRLLAENKHIPQEIVSYEKLLLYMR